MTVFKHKFFGLYESDAKRHINPDGSEGGIVAVSAIISDGVTIHLSSEVGGGAYIGNCASIGRGASIGYKASIGNRAYIGNGARIGNLARISDGASISDWTSIAKDEWWISLCPQGSRNSMLTAVQKAEGLRWWVGCKTDISTDELRELVSETHGGTDHEADYLHVIDFVERHPARNRAAVPAKARCING